MSDEFKMLVPVYVDYGKGWVKMGSATLIGNSSIDSNNEKLPRSAKKVMLCAMADVLALNIQNTRIKAQ